MSPGKVIKVECQCGYLLFKYYKGGPGRLLKCYLDRISKDYVGIAQDVPVGAQPTCPACGKELGVVKMIHRRPAIKLNQGTIKKTRT